VGELAAIITAQRYVLVVIDTLARCMVGADENSARDMGEAIDALDRLRRAAGSCVLPVHHMGKPNGTTRTSG
jgi:RecA-family ATPase